MEKVTGHDTTKTGEDIMIIDHRAKPKQAKKQPKHGSKKHLAMFLAWCEGKQIQSKKPKQSDAMWKDCNNPTFVDTMDYRVKPPRMIPKQMPMYGYWSHRTQSYFTTSKIMDTWKAPNYPRKPELDHIATIYVPES